MGGLWSPDSQSCALTTEEAWKPPKDFFAGHDHTVFLTLLQTACDQSKAILKADIRIVLISYGMQALLVVEPRLRGEPILGAKYLEPRPMSSGVIPALSRIL